MIKCFFKQLLLSQLFLFIASSGFSQEAKIKQQLDSIMKKYQAVGMAVAVVKGEDVIYNDAFGLKDIDNQTKLSTKDIFRIASISKSFSATAIMQLVEQRKISLTDDFGKLIGFKVRNPKFPNRVITLKMVLSHTSSINDSQGYFSLDSINPDKNPNWEKCYNNYEPGKGYQYCNLNFNMVGAVIEKTSLERFDSYIKNHILNPLGLYGGYCIDSLDHNLFTTLYEYNHLGKKYIASPAAYNPRTEELKKYVIGYSTPVFSPTGGMKISAIDLAKYMAMHLNKGSYKGVQVIAKKSAKIMQKPLSKEENYGLAIEKTDHIIEGITLKGHTGSAYGLYSAMFFDPKSKFGIVVIVNGCLPVYKNKTSEMLTQTINCLYNNLILN